jgi:hypothetical protein
MKCATHASPRSSASVARNTCLCFVQAPRKRSENGICRPERWQSGRLHLTRNQESLYGDREFESPPFLSQSFSRLHRPGRVGAGSRCVRLDRRGADAPFGAKIVAQLLRRFRLQDAACYAHTVIERRRRQDVDDAAGGPALRIGATVDEPLDASGGDRPGTHGAGFLGDIERAAGSPCAQRLRGGANRQNFRVRRGVRTLLFFVARLEGTAARNENGADRDFARCGCLACQRQGAKQQSLVARIVLPARLERATPAFGGRYSIQLSYGSAALAGSGVTD